MFLGAKLVLLVMATLSVSTGQGNAPSTPWKLACFTITQKGGYNTIRTGWFVCYFYFSKVLCLLLRDNFWPFVLCMYEHGESQNMDDGRQCAKKFSLDWSRIQSCVEGDLGKRLETMHADTTASLSPPHTVVPWITINGVVRKREQETERERHTHTHRERDKERATEPETERDKESE